MAGNHTHKYLLAQEKIKQAVDLLNIDDRLPGERVLAKDLGISYMTVRKAIENLVEEGVLYKVPKKGCYVADPKLKRKKTIGYFLDSSIEEGVTSPYYSLIFDALEKQAAKQGNALIYFSESNEGDLSSETLKVIEKLDGVIKGSILRCKCPEFQLDPGVQGQVIDASCDLFATDLDTGVIKENQLQTCQIVTLQRVYRRVIRPSGCCVGLTGYRLDILKGT